MAKAKDSVLIKREAVSEDEDENTLAAIDEGIRDADAARTTPIEKVRKRMHTWITVPSLRRKQ